MPGFFDRLGKAAQQTAAETRIRLEINQLTGRFNEQAQALGLLMYRQSSKGEEIAEEEYTKLLDEMAQIDSQRQAREAEMEELHRPVGAAAAPPAPAPAPSPAAPPPAPAPADPAAAAPVGNFCPNCGAANAPGAKFCPSCGQRLGA